MSSAREFRADPISTSGLRVTPVHNFTQNLKLLIKSCVRANADQCIPSCLQAGQTRGWCARCLPVSFRAGVSLFIKKLLLAGLSIRAFDVQGGGDARREMKSRRVAALTLHMLANSKPTLICISNFSLSVELFWSFAPIKPFLSPFAVH